MNQQLSIKLKNTLQNTSLVLNPVSLILNREETLSVLDKVLANNNLEENQSGNRETDS